MRPILTFLLLAAPATVTAQGIRGRVTDAATHAPVVGARVRLTSLDGKSLGETITNDSGLYVIKAPRDGDSKVFADRIGYSPIEDGPVSLRAEFTDVQVRMGVQPVRINALIVATERQIRALEEVGFYGRKEKGFGQFIDQQQIDRRNPSQTTDVLEGTAGVRIIPNKRTGERMLFLRAGLGGLKPCPPKILIDGIPTSVDKVDLISVRDIAAIEVYPGTASVPVQFGGKNATCGVMVFWLKRGGG